MDNKELAIIPTTDDEVQMIIERQKARRKAKTEKGKRKTIVKGSKGKFEYVKAQAAMEWLEDNFVVLSIEEVADSIHSHSNWLECAVRVTVADKETGVKTTVQRFGACEAVPKGDRGQLSVPPVKAAMADAIKRVCVALGGFRDVYGEVEPEDVAQASAKELVWYFNNVVPIIKKKWLEEGNVELFFKQMYMFANKQITVEELCSAYQLINPFNKES